MILNTFQERRKTEPTASSLRKRGSALKLRGEKGKDDHRLPQKDGAWKKAPEASYLPRGRHCYPLRVVLETHQAKRPSLTLDSVCSSIAFSS